MAPHMFGNQIGNIFNPMLSMEMIYSFVIIFCSLMIYYVTKEMYELSSHKGIKYFRYSFLFFAIAYFLRTFIKFLLVYFGVNNIILLNPRFIGQLSLFFFIYAGSVAVFYLVYSLVYNKWKFINGNVYLIHLISILFSAIIIIYNNVDFFIWLNLALFLLASFSIYAAHIEGRKHKKKKNGLILIYVLLVAFWVLNIIDIVIPNFLGGIQLLIYLFSIGIFLTIFYKVIKRVGAD